MKLTERQRQTIHETIVALDEERLRLNQELSDCVSKGILIGTSQTKLKRMRRELEDILDEDAKVKS